ncbi:MAG TPA: response regulator [Nitrososphaera sp.]
MIRPSEMRILIAEDDPDTWTPYKTVLEKRGHIVDIAQDGEECVKVYKTALKDTSLQNTTEGDEYSDYHYVNYINKSITNSNNHNGHTLSSSSSSSHSSRLPLPPYDAVVLDYRMPKKDGLEVAKEILTLNPSQRIIFASAYVKETLRESVKELRQVVELIQKPFLPEALVDVVEDTEAYPELKKLFVNIRKMTESDFENPSPDQIKNILDGLKKIQKERTF